MTLLKLYSQRRKIFLVSNLKSIQINSKSDFPTQKIEKQFQRFLHRIIKTFCSISSTFYRPWLFWSNKSQMPTFIVASANPLRKGKKTIIIFHQRTSKQRLINIFNLTSFHKTTKYSPKEISAAQHFDYSL